MNNPLNKAIRKMFLKHKFKFLGMMVMLIITTALFTFLSNTANYHSNVQNYLNTKYNMEDGTLVINESLAISPQEKNTLLTKFTNKYKNELTSNLVSEKITDNTMRQVENQYNQNEKVSNATMITTNNRDISKYYIQKGKFDLSGNNVVVTPKFVELKKHNIGENFTINKQTFKISGIVKTPSNTTDFISTTNNYVVMSEKNYQKFNLPEMSKILFKFKKTTNLDSFRNKILTDKDLFVKSSNNSIFSNIIYLNDNPSTSSFKAIATQKGEAYVVLIVFGLISLIMFVIITTKIIDSFSQEIGVLKALGYTTEQIKRNFIIYSSLITIIAIALGTSIGVANLSDTLIKDVKKLSYPSEISLINFDVWSIIFGIILPTILLILSINMVISKLLKTDVLVLISGLKENNKKSNLEFENLPIKKALRYRILLSSPSRALALFIGAFFGMTLITIIATSVYTSIVGVKDATITINAKSLVSDSNYIAQRKTNKSNEIYNFNLNIINVKRKNNNVNNVKSLSKLAPYALELTALETDFNKFALNKEEEKAAQTGVVMPNGFKKAYKVEIGDDIILQNPLTKKEYVMKITKFNKNEMNFLTFTSRKAFEAATGYKNQFNAVIAQNKSDENKIPNSPTKDIQSFKDLKEMPMKIIQFTIPVLVIMSILVFLFILPIVKISTSFVIEENNKNISVLRALGYTNKEISSMMLNVYSIVILAAIIVASLVLYLIMPFIDAQMSNIGFSSFALTWNIIPCLIGGVIIFAIYQLTILSSKRKLKKLEITKLLTM